MNKKGFTLVEMLVAVALLSLVLSMVSSGVVTAMKANRVQEAASTSQTRARRVLEIVSQDLRSAALGGIVNSPYVSNANAISFPRLVGGAGYDAPWTIGANSWFRSTTDTTSQDWVGDLRSVLVVDKDNGNAFVSPVTGAVWGRWNCCGPLIQLSHGVCGNAAGNLGAGLNSTEQNNNLLFRVDSVGYSFDAAQNRLLQRRAGGAALTVAFDIEDFTVAYVYRNKATGALSRLAAPMTDVSGASIIENNIRKLTQIQIDLDVAEPSSGRDADGNLRTITRTYTSYVDLTDSSSSFQIGKVGTC